MTSTNKPKAQKLGDLRATDWDDEDYPKPPVILLHGLGLTHRSMKKLADALSTHGWETLNLAYSSRRYKLETIAAQVWSDIQTQLGDPPPRVNFVTHSTGGIIVRLLARETQIQIHRVVMIAPPNQGTEWADFIPPFWLKHLTGSAATQLSTASSSVPNQLGPISFLLGIIAGNKPDNPLAPFLFSSPNDGRVSVERTKVAGMSAHLVLPYGHFYLRYMPVVIEQTLRYLEVGDFNYSSGLGKS
ncbi:MAG: alpha/beta hydrolase [Anaerolineae bacterium]|nr:alpha/beta hydrolase [Anaerolineae bacterium]